MIRFKTLAWALTAFIFMLWPPPGGSREQSVVEIKPIVSVDQTPATIQKLAPLHLDLMFEWEGRIYIQAAPEDLRTLERLGVPYILESAKLAAQNPPYSSLQGGINGDYHSSQELEAELMALERSFPQLARVFTIGSSLEKRRILAVKISDNVGQDEDEPEVLFLGCHHAREWISVEVPFLLAKYLVDNYPVDPEVRNAVNRSEIWIVPLVNPDGLEYSIHYYRYWRKNRRLNADGTYGVDINRNYGYQWGYDNLGSSGVPASEVYRGPAPFSEPETQAIRDLFLQKNFQSVVSYHSYDQLILYPWGYARIPTGQDDLLASLASAMSTLMRSPNGRIYKYGPAAASLYTTNGDTTDWTFSFSGVPSFTIELPPLDQLQGGFFNAEQDILPIFRENLPAALYLINWAIQRSGSAPAPSQPNALLRKVPKDKTNLK
jgi:murein tripeptide amidase MpaA